MSPVVGIPWYARYGETPGKNYVSPSGHLQDQPVNPDPWWVRVLKGLPSGRGSYDQPIPIPGVTVTAERDRSAFWILVAVLGIGLLLAARK